MSAVAAARDVHPVRLSRGVTLEFRRIPAGCFLMGSRGFFSDEEPRHGVRITHDFYAGTYPVTQVQVAVWTRAKKVDHRNFFDGNPEHPAESLTWYEAGAFCAWLNEPDRRLELPAGYVAVLPTEAEWEYACRAGTDTEYYTGDGASALGIAGWYHANSGGGTGAVGGQAANAFGLYDMHGNVWEWCADAWAEDAYKTRVDGVEDPGARHRWVELRRPSEQGERGRDARPRVVRGGSWLGDAWGCRSAFRVGWGPDLRNHDLGFRVCLVPGPVSASGQDRERLETERGGTPRRSRKARGARKMA